MTLAERLVSALGRDSVASGPENVIVYEYDYGLDRGMPDLVALPRSTTEVQQIVREARAAGVPIVARGAGTGISGGAVPHQGGLIVSMARMIRVLEIDAENKLRCGAAGRRQPRSFEGHRAVRALFRA